MDEARARAERDRRRDPEDAAARRRLHAASLRARPVAFLTFIAGPRAGDELRIMPGEGPLVLGRGRAADIDVPDVTLPRRALALCYRGERLRVEDFGSFGGSFVNEVQVKRRRFLDEGDVLRTGRTGLAISYRGQLGPSAKP